MECYDESSFRKQVDKARKTVERILEVHRNPRLPDEVDHEYSDKYLLVEQMTNTALIALFNVLVHFGLSAEVLRAIDQTKPTTLRFQASQSCTFLRESTVTVPLRATQQEEQRTYSHQSTSTQSSQSYLHNIADSVIKQFIHHVRSYHWKVSNSWEISIISGSDVEGRKILKTRSSWMEVIIESKSEPPLPEHIEFPSWEVSLSGWLQLINVETMTSRVAIDRQAPTTRTPRRNEELELFLTMMKELLEWKGHVLDFFIQNVFRVICKWSLAGPTKVPAQEDLVHMISGLSTRHDFFVPVLPLMETSNTTLTSTSTAPATEPFLTSSFESSHEFSSLISIEDKSLSSTILSTNDMRKVLSEHVRCIEELIGSLQKTYPSPASTALLSVEEVSIITLCFHSRQLERDFNRAIDYIEHMLRNQLVAAVGKQIQSTDIDDFMRYHNARLLQPAPVAFCHSIRQPNHDPVGIVSIESTEPDGSKLPIQTLSRKVDVSCPFKLPLNAQTTVELTGQTYLHGWIRHRFGRDEKSFELIARARQFSVFLLVVGTMSGADTLDPKDAIIVQNKDEVLIPLLLEEIPTAKEFKDAIRSLSPEQQQFAQAFRSMQLGSSVMGICVIQIKPQLEVLLGVGEGSLMKEMKLTQDLMELFVEYQVPSDLVCYDGIDPGASSKEKVENVRSHVNAVLDVIGKTKATLDMVWSGTRDESFYDWLCAEPDSAQCRPRDFVTILTGEMSMDIRSNGEVSSTGHTQVITASQHVEERLAQSTSSSVASQQDSATVPFSTIRENNSCADFAVLPQVLNSRIETQAGGAAMRSTTIKLSDTWQRNRQENLFSKPKHSFLRASESIKAEKNKAFDLLDALSRSSSLPIAFSELHVMVAVTHAFEKDLIDTVIQDNINPIEKLEMSTLLVGSAIHGVSASALVREESQLSRLATLYPGVLF